MQYSNGDVYEGFFHNGAKHGKGLKYFVNGAFYSGDYKMDQQFG